MDLQKNNNLIVKDNKLINAGYRLDIAEKRLILMAILEARKQSKDLTEDGALKIFAKDYARIFSSSPKSAYRTINNASKSLYDRSICFEKHTKKSKRIINYRWITVAEYNDQEGYVAFKFNEAIEPLITSLERHFTSYAMESVTKLSSIYSIRLYELIISWKNASQMPKISIADLRFKLGVKENEYKRIAHLKEKVIHKAIDQINEHTNIRTEYIQHKQGRNITHFTFTFRQVKEKKMSFEKWVESNNLAYIGESWEDAKKRLQGDYLKYKNQTI